MIAGARLRFGVLDALVLCLGVVVLTAPWLAVFPGLAWSDEYVYAVMARNVAEGRGLVTNLYHSRALLEGGFPLGDVHMPGQAVWTSAFLRVFGPGEWVPALASQAAFVLAGWLTYRAACARAGRAAGVAAAVLLLLTPSLAAYSHTAMPEAAIVMISAAVLAFAGRLEESGAAWRAVALAGLICCAVLLRESLLVLAPIGFLAATRARQRRVFTIALGLGLASLVPLYLSRAPYPHFLSDLPRGAGLLVALREQALANLSWPHPGAFVWDWVFVSQYCLGLVLPIVVLVSMRSRLERRLAAELCFLLAATFAGLMCVYPLRGWAAVRVLLFLAPWSSVLLAALCVSPGRRAWLPLGLAVALGLGWLTMRASGSLARDRARERRAWSADTEYLLRFTAGRRIDAISARGAFDFAWRAFPAVVIWNGPSDAATLARLDRRLRLDAVVVGRDDVSPLQAAAEAGQLGFGVETVGQNPQRHRQLLLRSKRDPARP